MSCQSTPGPPLHSPVPQSHSVRSAACLTACRFTAGCP
ncbi:unnamed protein product, partial [Staurois parvus]